MVALLSLFSGIGGLERGMEACGLDVVAQCEREPFARRILARHYAGVPCLSDVRDVDAGIKADAVCGGFPCQPHSHAGARKASDDDRDLWPEVRRVLGVVRPRAFLGENVSGLLTSEGGRFFGGIVRDLDALGYAVTWDHVPAVAVGAPHIRDRVFIAATLGDAKEADEAPWGLAHAGTQRWPRAGRYGRGLCYQRRPGFPVPRCAVMPTPTASDAANAANRTAGRKPGGNHHDGVTLTDYARMWPTPTALDHKDGTSVLGVPANGLLGRVVEPNATAGALSPAFVEWLMGFPLGWTDSDGPDLRDADAAPWDSEPCPRLTLVRKDRPSRLRCLGNAVVPAVASAACGHLVRM